ncbi:ferric reductase-like transmembrane domain-containing protein [Arthrobacter sp. FX8]|jgi:predicted ferric reductase|uniref:ferric reductase-like transmembrane domain-containing protein n=1 Tax=Micrococcaceae TaxID=1268 RepID=UPI001CC6DA1F|nr:MULTISPECIES: ferric reductase-like transmembrane domain-containing protein [unclassified Arthrobacter]WAJ34082.1 ferric reductase-like transmembrane domain-containing protein [Arthrobacter sp. FX8]
MDEAMWAFGRVSGFVSLALFTGSVLLGILNRSGRPFMVLPRFSISLLHRNISLLATVFLGLHVGSLLLDSYAKLNPVDIVVPFLGSFQPFWQGLGTVALDLVLAVVVTGLLRHRIGLRSFKAVHWLSYGVWPVAMAHALGNGTDASSGWFLLLAVASAVAVAAALLWRLSPSFLETSHARQGNLP